MKICTKCNIEKPIIEFYSTKKGHESRCKECKQNYIKENNKKYGKEYFLENTRKYKQNNKEKTLQDQRTYYHNNKKYWVNNPKRKEYLKKWNSLNREKLNEYTLNRYKNNDQFRLGIILRNRFKQAIKGFNIGDIKTLIGCSIEEFKIYLEKQFLPEMSWENHGNIWEIDHIKPCASFDLTDIKQQKECFHYTNIQPLFKTTEIAENFGYTDQIGNRNKSNKLI
jgi:hypothetical protein